MSAVQVEICESHGEKSCPCNHRRLLCIQVTVVNRGRKLDDRSSVTLRLKKALSSNGLAAEFSLQALKEKLTFSNMLHPYSRCNVLLKHLPAPLWSLIVTAGGFLFPHLLLQFRNNVAVWGSVHEWPTNTIFYSGRWLWFVGLNELRGLCCSSLFLFFFGLQ